MGSGRATTILARLMMYKSYIRCLCLGLDDLIIKASITSSDSGWAVIDSIRTACMTQWTLNWYPEDPTNPLPVSTVAPSNEPLHSWVRSTQAATTWGLTATVNPRSDHLAATALTIRCLFSTWLSRSIWNAMPCLNVLVILEWKVSYLLPSLMARFPVV